MLYHSSSMFSSWARNGSAVEIFQLMKDRAPIEPRTKHAIDGAVFHGMSTTRNHGMAFESRTYGDVVFELNPDIIKQHNRIIPIDGHVSYSGLEYGSDINKNMRFDSYQFDKYSAIRFRSRFRYSEQGFNDLAEEFVVGEIRHFHRCVNRVYLLNTKPDTKIVEDVREICEPLNIPLTVESQSHTIRPEDIIKSYHYQRKIA